MSTIDLNITESNTRLHVNHRLIHYMETLRLLVNHGLIHYMDRMGGGQGVQVENILGLQIHKLVPEKLNINEL